MQLDISNILKTLETELSQRLEKLWRVFNWCSSILITIGGGQILAIRSINKFNLLPKDRIIISLIIITIVTYAWLWIRENLKFESKIRNRIYEIYESELQDTYLKSLRPDNAKFGYLTVILVLGIITLFATWLDYIVK